VIIVYRLMSSSTMSCQPDTFAEIMMWMMRRMTMMMMTMMMSALY